MSTVKPRTGHDCPNLPPTHYVDNRVYTDPALFEAERERVFGTAWLFVCHESEVASPGDFRTTSVAGRPVVVVRGTDGTIRVFYNICRHRGAKVMREESGHCRAMQCFYHLWTYDLEGRLAAITKPEGYEKVGLDPGEFGLLPLRAETLAGLVFVCACEATEPLRDYVGETVPLFEAALGGLPLEAFQFYRAEFKINWKLWQDNNSETYHAFLHALLRKTAAHVKDGGGPMHVRTYPRGHGALYSGGTSTVDLGRSGFDGMTGGALPTMGDRELRIINIFPDMMINIRSNVVRLDRLIPLAPDRTLLEWRGLAVKGDSPELRAVRTKHHNLFWGPAGRNLLEDMLACEAQQECMAADVVRYSIIARDEGGRPTDDSRLRNFYREWERCVGRPAHDPFGEAC